MASQLANSPYAGVDNYTQYVTAKLNLKTLTKVKPLRPEFGPVLNNVTAFQYSIGIRPCLYVKDNINLFVAIISAVGNFKKRESIRQTWLRTIQQSDNNSSTSLSGYGFFVGQTRDQKVQLQIEDESKIYGDIVQIDFIDYYYNLTLKVVGLTNWLNQHCSEVDFVLKVDDDVFVNVRNLEAVIAKCLNGSEPTFFGTSTYHPAERGGKWNISYEDYPWDVFPPYPSGGAVLLPGIAIEPLLAATQVVPYLPFDDTYLLGLCAEKAGIKLKEISRFFATGGNLNPCYVHHFITWLTDSTLRNLNNSYFATEDFYMNLTQCIIVLEGKNHTVDPFDFDELEMN